MAWGEPREVGVVHDQDHDDLRGGMGFDPRQRSCMKYVCRYSESDVEAGVWRAMVVVRWVAREFSHYRSWDELDEAQNQLSCRTATVGIAAPCVNASVLEMGFPSIAWVTRRMTAKNCPALKVSWALNVG